MPHQSIQSDRDVAGITDIIGIPTVLYPRGTHEAEATSEVDWWDRTRAEYITITTNRVA